MGEIAKPKPPTQRQYNAAEINLALSLLNIRPCENCGWPYDASAADYTIKCPTCGTHNP